MFFHDLVDHFIFFSHFSFDDRIISGGPLLDLRLEKICLAECCIQLFFQLIVLAGKFCFFLFQSLQRDLSGAVIFFQFFSFFRHGIQFGGKLFALDVCRNFRAEFFQLSLDGEQFFLGLDQIFSCGSFFIPETADRFIELQIVFTQLCHFSLGCRRRIFRQLVHGLPDIFQVALQFADRLFPFRDFCTGGVQIFFQVCQILFQLFDFFRIDRRGCRGNRFLCIRQLFLQSAVLLLQFIDRFGIDNRFDFCFDLNRSCFRLFDRFIQIRQLFFQPVVFALQQGILRLQIFCCFLSRSHISGSILEVKIDFSGICDRFFDLCFQFAVFPFQIVILFDQLACSFFSCSDFFFQRLEGRGGIIQFFLEVGIFLFQEFRHADLGILFFLERIKEIFQTGDLVIVFCNLVLKSFFLVFNRLLFFQRFSGSRILLEFGVFRLQFLQFFFERNDVQTQFQLPILDGSIFCLIFLQFVLIIFDTFFCSGKFSGKFFIRLDVSGVFQFHFEDLVFLQKRPGECIVSGGTFIIFCLAFVISNSLLKLCFFGCKSRFFGFQQDHGFPDRQKFLFHLNRTCSELVQFGKFCFSCGIFLI